MTQKQRRNWVKWGLGFSLAGTALLSFIGFFGIRELEKGAHWADHSYQVIQVLQKIQLDLKQSEADYAKFLLTRDDKYLKPLQRGMDEAGEESEGLIQAAQDDPLPSGSLVLLRDLVQRKTGLLQRGIQWGQAGQWALAVDDLQSPGHKALDAEIQSTTQGLARLESWSLKVHQATEDSSSRRNLEILAACGAVTLAVCLAAAFMIRAQSRRRRIADQLLKSSENKFHALAEATNEAFLTFDEKGILLSLNTMTETLLGYPRKELMGKPFILLLSPRFLERRGLSSWTELLSQTHSENGVEALEMEMMHKNGHEIPVEITLNRWENQEGRFFTLMARDISERRFFTRTLLENEHRLFQFLEIVPVGIFVMDSGGRPYYANQEAKKILGKGIIPETAPKDFCRDYHFLKTGGGDFYPAEKLPLLRALKGEKSSVEDLEVQGPEGRMPLQMWGAPVLDGNEGVKFAVAALVSIAERQAAERTIRENEEKFQAVTETAIDGVVLCDALGGIRYFNPSAEGIFGYTAQEVLGKPFSMFLPERLHKIYRDDLAPGKGAGAEKAPRTEVVGRRKDGSEFPLEVTTSTWETKEGFFYSKILRDISLRRQAEGLLQEREEIFRNLFEEGPIGMTLTDRDRKWVNVNYAFCHMINFRKKDLIGQGFQTHSEDEDGMVDQELADRLFNGMIPHYHMEKRYITRSGERIWCKVTASVVLDKDGKPLYLLSVVENIDELKKVDEMKTDLISVVSHQLKTPVGEINGYIENLLEGLAGELKPKQKAYLEDMREIGANNFRLISDLLNVS
ncbi:MAG TPA: PAS domain S-box protein, partial [bacterium]|nr:PAS domain S-box protein [bacterium]